MKHFFSMGLAWLALNGKIKDPTVNPLTKAEEAFMSVVASNPRTGAQLKDRSKSRKRKLRST